MGQWRSAIAVAAAALGLPGDDALQAAIQARGGLRRRRPYAYVTTPGLLAQFGFEAAMRWRRSCEACWEWARNMRPEQSCLARRSAHPHPGQPTYFSGPNLAKVGVEGSNPFARSKMQRKISA